MLCGNPTIFQCFYSQKVGQRLFKRYCLVLSCSYTCKSIGDDSMYFESVVSQLIDPYPGCQTLESAQACLDSIDSTYETGKDYSLLKILNDIYA